MLRFQIPLEAHSHQGLLCSDPGACKSTSRLQMISEDDHPEVLFPANAHLGSRANIVNPVHLLSDGDLNLAPAREVDAFADGSLDR